MTTNRPDLDTAHWEARFAALVEKHGIPGAQLGILRLGADGAEDEVFERETIVLQRDADTWTCIHEHLSPDPARTANA